MRGHLPALDHGGMDLAPARYMIRINGHLGATMLSAFPAMPPRRHGAHTVPPGRWTSPRCTASWLRSRPSAWTCSRYAGSSPNAKNRNQVTAAHLAGR